MRVLIFTLIAFSSFLFCENRQTRTEDEINERIKQQGRYALITCTSTSVGTTGFDPQIIQETFILDRKFSTYEYNSGYIEFLNRTKYFTLFENSLEITTDDGVYEPTSDPKIINTNIVGNSRIFQHDLGIYSHKHKLNTITGTDIMTIGYSKSAKSSMAPNDKDLKKRRNKFLLQTFKEKGTCFASGNNWKIVEMNKSYSDEIAKEKN